MDSRITKPLITTIIPTYRRPELLQRAIQSVLNQTYPHFQVCVYDNASGDETAAFVTEIQKRDPRVKYHCHPHNIGAIQNFNFGLRRVVTPYFSLLSDDNVLLPQFFECAINKLKCHSNAVLFAGQAIRVNERGQKVSGSLDHWDLGIVPPPKAFLSILEKGIPNWESVVFRSEIIKKVGLLNASFHGAADQDFMMRIARNHTFYTSAKPCALFLFHKNSWSSNRDPLEVMTTIKKRLQPFLQDESLSPKMKLRIRKARRNKINATIREVVYKKCLAEENAEAIEMLSKLMSIEEALNFKTLIVIMLAKLSSHIRILKKWIACSAQWYLQLRRNGISIGNRRNLVSLAITDFDT